MAEELRHIEHIGTTRALARSNLDSLQICIESTESVGSRYIGYMDEASNYHVVSVQKYIDSGGTTTYMDNETKDLDVNGTGYFAESILHLGDTDTGIVLTDDKVTIKAGGTDLIECTESTDDTIQFNVPIILPNLTSAQKEAISAPTTGMMIFDTDNAQVEVYHTATWNGI